MNDYQEREENQMAETEQSMFHTLRMALREGLATLGFQGLNVESLTEENADGELHLLRSFTGDPLELGQLRGLFATITVEVSVGIGLEIKAAEISLKYNWEHPGGATNGFTVRYIFNGDKGEWNHLFPGADSD